MDILSHTLSGIAIGTVAASFVRTSKYSVKKKFLIVLSGALAGAIPDIDAISLWSGFDDFIGNPLGLSRSGREIYFGKLWYSHHGMFHSLFMGLLIPLLWWLLGGIFSRNRLKLAPRIRDRWQRGKLGMLTFFIAYGIHCFEDMITPSGSWGGVRLLYPSAEYYGGWSKIWWWNNYDLFLIILSVILFNLVCQLFKKHRKFLVSFSIVIGVFLFALQIARRPNLNSAWNKNELASKQLQKKFLGSNVFNMMKKFDNSMELNF